jgi:hypothetical protein
VSLARARKIALATKDAEYDENYPTIIVSATNLKDSSIQSMELFKRWAEPIYRGMHEMTNGINQYFIEDLVDGLSVAQDGIEKVDSQITKVSETGLKATELKEEKQAVSEKPNLKEYIKSSPLDDILEELLR